MSFAGGRCFIHPAKVAQGIHASSFAKKIVAGTLQITGRGFGLYFEVTHLNNLPQTPESVIHLGEWPVSSWVVDPDPDNHYP